MIVGYASSISQKVDGKAKKKYHEKTQSVEYKREAVEQKGISPYQGVQESLTDVLPSKLLLLCGVGILIQAR
jgi:hypothetical protein